VGQWGDPRVLPDEIEQAMVLPGWWFDPPDFVLKNETTHFAVDVGSESLRELQIAFYQPDEEITLELRDMQGNIIRQGARDPLGRMVVETANLSEGSYLLSVARPTVGANEARPLKLKIEPPQVW
jgi:hypothetical protein